MKQFLILILLLTIPLSYGLGVAQDYMEDNTLRLLKGESHFVRLTLQNPEDVSVNVKITLESEVAELTDKNPTYNLSPKSFDNELFIKITCPKNAKIGDYYTVTYAVEPQTSSDGGQIGMNMRIRRSFDVVIVNEDGVGYNKYIMKKAREETPKRIRTVKSILIGILSIVILAGIFIGLVKKSNLLSEKLLKKDKTIQKDNKQKKEQIKLKKEIKPETTDEEEKQELKSETAIPDEQKIKDATEIKKELEQPAESQDQYFYFHNGTTLKSIMDIYYYLRVMPQETFKIHVSTDKNDFSNWVLGVFKKPELAKTMKFCQTKEEMMKAIEHEWKK
ncbi:MAG: hypothetical protein ABIC91_06425 [Nanoarchaeota archaeon]|nr:hypothetical protein [Nanoarchaeota archaeon]MBU1030409.1 hypothetical protein [Nanoarchaeota archaeon]MBU1850031.1 hypothetical protein [Nanoarchaeota archaeon]